MLQRNSQVVFIAVSRMVSIVDILKHYGFMSQLHRNGDNLMGTCPLHNGREHEVTFHVIVSKNCWNCLTPCKSGGNVIEFVANKEHVSFFKAALLLIEWFNLRVDGEVAFPDAAEITSLVENNNLAKCGVGRPEDNVNDENNVLKSYVGTRHYHQTAVMVNGRPLNPRFDLWNYHPLEAFEWGYCGAGPSQLSLALLADCLGDDHLSSLLSAGFRRTVVEKLDGDDEWVLYNYQIRRIVTSLRRSC
jgi:hypothetical protein